MASASELWVYNVTSADIEVDELGITLPAEDAINLAHFTQSQIWAANTLVNAVVIGNAGVVSDFGTSPPTLWSIASAIDILQMGVNSFQVGLHKVLTPGIVDGRYYSAVQDPTDVIPNAISVSHLYATPVAYMAATFNRIGVEVTTSIPNGIIHLGIYTNNDGVPGDLLLDAGYVATDTIGQKEIAIDILTPMEWYWLCAVSNVAVVCQTVTQAGLATSVFGVVNDGGDFAIDNGTSFPSSFPTVSSAWENPPMIWLRHV